MTTHLDRRRFRLLPVLLVVALIPGAVVWSQAPGEKTMFVSVLDPNGNPVTDLTTAEFAIREDNVNREVVSARLSTRPLSIALLADTTKDASEFVSDIRSSVGAFVREVSTRSPESEIALMEFGQAALTVTNFTNKLPDLEKGIARLFPKPDAQSVLLEALIEAGKNLSRRKNDRRAIVILNIEPGDEQSRQDPNRMVEEIRRSRATVWAVSLQEGSLRNPARDLVLNVLTQRTGGRREFIVGPSGLETWLKNYATALTSQYEVTYKRPEGKAQAVQVGVTRMGLKILATVFAPQ